MDELAEKDTREIFYEKFCKINNLLNHRLDFKDSKPNPWKSFSEDVPLIAPVITMAALYWIDSRYLWNDSLKAQS